MTPNVINEIGLITSFMKIYFEDAGELIVENLLVQGQSPMSDCIQTVCEKLDDGTKDETGDFKLRVISV